MQLGAMPMPSTFKYRDVFLKGKPRHNALDAFTIRHPPMPASRWAKIFSPFDALKGFDEAIGSKEVRYVDRVELEEDEKRDLDHRLFILRGYTFNSRLARANRVMVTVRYFVPCADQDAFGPEKGRYETASGMVLNVDEFHETMTLQEENSKAVIDFADLLSIEPENPRLFEDCPDWE